MNNHLNELEGLKNRCDRFVESINNTNLAFWNSLLTINGLFVTLFSVFIIFYEKNQFFFLGMIAFSVISSYLIIKNLYKHKTNLETLLNMTQGEILRITVKSENKKSQLPKSIIQAMQNGKDLFDDIKYRNTKIMKIIAIQTSLLLFFLTFKLIFKC